ncbi:sugar transferase [Olavius algarvensis associated proteobacterium Delta 3]|nr:sugar transferase [Olavius algarvensis associated proteobacterium Delta 3]CAB5101228.1 sugar transferase [Olavius algarvensis associated proteobacterium Delta 3]
MKYAPIALFVYSRLGHARETVHALKNNQLASESDLIVFSDGPRSDRDVESVKQVRQYILGINGFKSVSVVLRDQNLGLSRSLISGVSQVLETYDRTIVLEDDIITSPFFLQYMNDGLNYYVDDERVISIHGYVLPVKYTLPETFFLIGTDCWGWGTWRRGWALFNSDGRYLLNELIKRKLVRQFDLDGAYPYTRMLKRQINGKNDSWAIRWYASAFLENKLTLYPGRSMIQNIGTDASGTHCGINRDYDTSISSEPIKVGGIDIIHSSRGYEAYRELFLKMGGASRVRRVIQRLLAFVRRRQKHGRV